MVERLDGQRRHVARPRQAVVHQRAGEELAGGVVHDFLAQGGAEPLHDPAVQLALDHGRVDRPPAVVHGRIAQEPHHAGLHVDLHRAGVGAEGPCHRLRMEEQARV